MLRGSAGQRGRMSSEEVRSDVQYFYGSDIKRGIAALKIHRRLLKKCIEQIRPMAEGLWIYCAVMDRDFSAAPFIFTTGRTVVLKTEASGTSFKTATGRSHVFICPASFVAVRRGDHERSVASPWLPPVRNGRSNIDCYTVEPVMASRIAH